MADKEKKRGTPFIVNLLLVAVVIIIKYFVCELCLTAVSTVITGQDDWELAIAYIIASFLSSIICGFLLAVILFRRVQNDGEEHRLVLEYFRETPYDNSNIKEYLKADKQRKKEFIIFAILLFLLSAVGDVINGLLFAVYPFIIEYIVMIVICRVFDNIGRRRLYKKWDSERMHR